MIFPGGDLRQRHGAALSQRRQDVAGGTAGTAEGWLWQRLAGRSSAPENCRSLRKELLSVCWFCWAELEYVVIRGWKFVKHVAELRLKPDFERATWFLSCSGSIFTFVNTRKHRSLKSSEGPDVSFIYTSRWSIPSDWPHGEPPIPTDETLIPAGANCANCDLQSQLWLTLDDFWWLWCHNFAGQMFQTLGCQFRPERSWKDETCVLTV